MAKVNPRARRLGEQIQRELTELLRRDVKDGRIGNVTITAVDVTGDLRIARVHYLVFGKQGADPQVQRGLESAAGYLRNALSRALMIRYTPTLSFALDTSLEEGVRLTQLIDSVNRPADVGSANAGEAEPAAHAEPATHAELAAHAEPATHAELAAHPNSGARADARAEAEADADAASGHVIDAG